MTPEPEIAEILADWKAAVDRGESVSPEDVVRRHPARAAELRAAFAALALLDRAAGDVLPSAVPASLGGEGMPRGAPTRIGDFRLLRPIGLGATGNVYEAEQISMGRRVALKILHPSMTLSPRAVERFRREAQVAGRLHHTHIVPVHAMGTDGGMSWFAMELVEGQSLSHVIEDLRLLERAGKASDAPARQRAPSGSSGFGSTNGRREYYERVARAAAGVADALAAAHAAGVVHRDVKPGNLLLDRSGTLKLLDFGLARASEGGLPALTMTGDIVGTPSYMSPEQVRGDAVDGRTDVYGLGATLYELLTLRPPHAGKDVPECLRRILDREPVAPRRIDPRIPRDLETIVLRAMEKDPARRYGLAGTLARDLRAFADGTGIAARRVGPVGRALRSVRRHPLRSGLVATVLLASAGAAVFAVQARTAREEERQEAERRRNLEYEGLLGLARQGGAWDARLGLRHNDPLDRAIALIPERPEAWYLAAVCGVHTDPFADLDAARDRGLPPTIWRLARAALLRAQGRRAEARVEESFPEASAAAGPEAQVLRASIALDEGRLDDVERLVESALQETEIPRRTRMAAQSIRASARGHRGDYEGAIQDYMAARATHSAAVVPEAEARIYWLWRRLGRIDAAEHFLASALRDYAIWGTPMSYADLGAHLSRDGHTQACRQVLAKGRMRFPGDHLLRLQMLPDLPALERVQEAERILAELDAASPMRDAVLVRKAECLALDMDRPAEALLLLRDVRERLAPTGSVPFDLYRVHALASQRLGQMQDAESVYLEGLGRAPMDTLLRFEYAQMLSTAGRPGDALPVIEYGLDRFPSDLLLTDMKVRLLKELGRSRDAVELARRGVELCAHRDMGGMGTEVIAYPMHCVRLLRDTDPMSVVPLLERVTKARPEDGMAREDLAWCLFGAERDQDAWDALNRTPEPQPTDGLLDVRSQVAFVLGRYREARAAAESLVARAPDLPHGHLDLGRAMACLGEPELALRCLDKAIALNPTGPGTWKAVSPRQSRRSEPLSTTHLAMIYLARMEALAQLDRIGDAQRAADKVLSIRWAPETLCTIGDAWLRVGRFGESAAAMREAIWWLRPHRAPAQYHIALANRYLILDRLAEARRCAERGRIDPNPALSVNAACTASLAWSLGEEASGDASAQALELARIASDRAPGSRMALLAYAAATARAGRWAEAAGAWQRATDGWPDRNDYPHILLIGAWIDLGRREIPSSRARLAESRAMPWFRTSPLAQRLAAELERDLAAWERAEPKPR